MPEYKAPRGDKTRFAFLNTTKATAEQDIAAGNLFIEPETLDAVAAFLPEFLEKMETVSGALSGREKEVREQNDALETLETYTRDLWAVLFRRVHRLNEPAEVFTYYQLPLSGVMPRSLINAEWLHIAKEVVAGDALAVAAGYPAIINPSSIELAEIVQTAESEYGDVAVADRAYDIAQEELAELRTAADSHIQEVMDQLRFALRKKDAPSRRRIIRTYGATYKYAEGEPEEV